MGKIVEGVASGQQIVSASYPVMEEGKLVGVIGAALNVSWLANAVTTRTSKSANASTTFTRPYSFLPPSVQSPLTFEPAADGWGAITSGAVAATTSSVLTIGLTHPR